MPQITEALNSIVGSRLKENELMSKHTNFRIGGPAKWFVEVQSVDELKAVLETAKDNKTAFFVFGGGSNILVNDAGFEGIAIKMAMRGLEINKTTVRAEAGVLTSTLARETVKAGLAGLAWAVSVPGTVGGAVRGNAGCFGGETKDYLTQVELYRDGKIVTVTKDELQFSYRESSVKHSNDIVLAAIFELKTDNATELEQEIEKTLSIRKSSQPLESSSAGCVFKNYDVKTDEEMKELARKLEIPAEMRDKKRLSAGWIVDQLDLKGKQIGGAKVSEKHGNFIINAGNAKADEVIQLISVIKMRARDEYGILLEEEIQYIGF